MFCGDVCAVGGRRQLEALQVSTGEGLNLVLAGVLTIADAVLTEEDPAGHRDAGMAQHWIGSARFRWDLSPERMRAPRSTR